MNQLLPPALFADLPAAAAALGRMAQLAPFVAVGYRVGAPAVRLYHRGSLVLVLTRRGVLHLDARAGCSEALRGCYNRALAALGRPESFRPTPTSGWCVLGGPNQGPCRWAIGPAGRLGIYQRWAPL